MHGENDGFCEILTNFDGGREDLFEREHAGHGEDAGKVLEHFLLVLRRSSLASAATQTRTTHAIAGTHSCL